MNVNIPPIECYIRKEYLCNLESGHGELVEGTAFAIKSLQNTAMLFLVMTDIGAVYDKIPISALVPFDKPEAPALPFHELQLWDCFSYSPHVVQFMFLKGKRCQVMMKEEYQRPSQKNHHSIKQHTSSNYKMDTSVHIPITESYGQSQAWCPTHLVKYQTTN